MDVVPEGVSEVLSYFFPSKLQHLLLTDVISLYAESTIDAHFAATAHVLKVALAAAAAAATSTPSSAPLLSDGLGEKDNNEHSMLDDTHHPNPSTPLDPPPAFVVPSGNAFNPSLANTSSSNTPPSMGITRVGRLRLPQQYPINAVMMPVRPGAYLSFTRYGRVIERMIDVHDQQLQQQLLHTHNHTTHLNIIDGTTAFGTPLLPTPHTLHCPQQHWSLAFRDSNYGGDFHVSLLNTLRRCGRLVSVTFANSNKSNRQLIEQQDARMGWLVGNMPPTVRFVSLRNIMSSESIQTLCILLRKNNAAFLDPINTGSNNNNNNNNNSNSSSRSANMTTPDTSQRTIDSACCSSQTNVQPPSPAQTGNTAATSAPSAAVLNMPFGCLPMGLQGT